MKLHEYQAAFEGAISASAVHFGIPEIYIEKDYWVTFALKQIFSDAKTKEFAVFKGGTALSKCYKVIERFSEDIDIVVISAEDESGNTLKKKLKAVTNCITNPLIPIPGHFIENKKGKLRKLVYSYSKNNPDSNFGEVRDEIVVEVSNLGSPYPSEGIPIYSMIAEFIAATNNIDLIKQYELEPFNAVVLGVERTFCEKIISLVRFSYTDNPLVDLANKVRHTYDLHKLLQLEKIQSFLTSSKFETMLNQVGFDDDKAIPNDKDWLLKHPNEALIFKELETTWKSISTTYKGTFKDLVTGELPSEDEILDSLRTIKKALSAIKWKIKN